MKTRKGILQILGAPKEIAVTPGLLFDRIGTLLFYTKVPAKLLQKSIGRRSKSGAFPVRILTASIVLALAVLSHAKSNHSAQFEFLSSIRAAGDLVAPMLPRTYAVPVRLTGTIADEMRTTLKGLDLEEPEYMEIYDRKNGFSLILSNDYYSSDTRELLAGILNPIDMIDAVLNSIVRYRQEDKLDNMLYETKAKRQLIVNKGKAKWVVLLEPSGERFAYDYEDMGAYIHETWLTSMEITVDSASMLAEKLVLKKYSRLYSADSTGRPSPSGRSYQYDFHYDTLTGKPMPVKMTLAIDGVLSLSMEAAYRTAGSSIVFASRKICYETKGGKQACLELEYGEYQINADLQAFKNGNKNATSSNKIKQAAALALKAEEAIRTGNIKVAMRTLKNIIQNCEGTPQAVEARKLLEGLPDGF
jgi:hypothetical protein